VLRTDAGRMAFNEAAIGALRRVVGRTTSEGGGGSGRAEAGGEYVDTSFGRSEEGIFSDDAAVLTLAKAARGTLSGVLTSELLCSLISGSTVSRTDSGLIAFKELPIGTLSRTAIGGASVRAGGSRSASTSCGFVEAILDVPERSVEGLRTM